MLTLCCMHEFDPSVLSCVSALVGECMDGVQVHVSKGERQGMGLT